jgi:hypothetical protein
VERRFKSEGSLRGLRATLLKSVNRGFATAVALTIALVLANPATLHADEFVRPGISFGRVDWRAALDQLRSEVAANPDAMAYLTFPGGAGRSDPFNRRRTPTWTELNATTSQMFATISNSTIPVLLPFDVAAYLADRMTDAPNFVPAHYQSGFNNPDLFETGPSGYDAVFTLPLDARIDLPTRVFARPVEVHLTGSLLTYNIDDPSGGKGETVKSLAGSYPDIRRFVREGFVRYSFTKFGVPYVVSILCLDSVARTRRLSCREASPVAEHFIKSLRIAGGMPARSRFPIPRGDVERPLQVSHEFSYHAPGELIAHSGYRSFGGRPDSTVYAQMRFPLQETPAYANSQQYVNKDECSRNGTRCRVNDGPASPDEAVNGSYIWQDNFCEGRGFEAWQCPGGWGHQGQDIRPATCAMRADRCVPGRHPTVAVRDGVLVRAKVDQAAFVLVNERNEHIRFRYMHMEPGQMNADGLLFGRRVSEGEKIGAVSNYMDRAAGTSTHLHFDIQVFTRDGWIWVNPYTTLIASYEHLIGARGKLHGVEPSVETVTPAPSPEPRPLGVAGDHAEAVVQTKAVP